MNIASFIERKIKALSENKFVKIPTEKSYTQLVREAVLAANSMADRVSIEVNGIDVTQQHIDKVKIILPDALNKPKTFEAFGSDGSIFAIEVE